MDAYWIALLAALAVALAAWYRRRLRRARERCRQRLERFLEERRPLLEVLAAPPAALRIESGSELLAVIDLRRLTRAAAGRAEPSRERLFAALADAAAHRPRPLDGPYELKRHGLLTLPRLAGEGLPLLVAASAPVVFVAPEIDLPMIYRVDGEPGLTYVGEDHLAGAGIDDRDLHNVALAVLRQRFDADRLRRRIAELGLARLEPADGCGGSRLLLLPEALEPGERWWAVAPTPAVLLVGGERRAVERAAAECSELPEPLAPVLLAATAAGLAIADRP